MKIRLYFKEKLLEGKTVSVEKDSIHYLKTVLKVKTGDEIFLFNPEDGEVLDKTTQIGISSFMPITTKYSSVHHFSKERAEKIITEASEQSNRIEVPKVFNVMPFEKFISLHKNEKIIFCNEKADFKEFNILKLKDELTCKNKTAENSRNPRKSQ